jgi:hypothetical protein
MIEQESQVGGVSHQVGLATFSSSARLFLSLTGDFAAAKTAIAGLAPDARTNIGAGLQTGVDALSVAPTNARRVIILLSDGQTNEGLTAQGILSGPVQQAASSGICIYTVGFGDAGQLDESLLRQIAQTSGCGQYYYALDAYQLGNIYIKMRHQTLGQVLADLNGQVRQGRTTTPEPVVVPAGLGELNVTLAWKGSDLDLIMTDPAGRTVDARYPGASLVSYARFVYLIVKNPLAGRWQLAVFGRDVPEGVLDYAAIASARGSATATTTPPALRDVALVVIGLTAVAALTVAIMAFAWRRGAGPAADRVGGGQAGVVLADRGGSRAVAVQRGLLKIGRDWRNHVVLDDRWASRIHCQIRYEDDGYVLYDLNSKNGTFLNGRRISRSALADGDEIRIGDTTLTFRRR